MKENRHVIAHDRGGHLEWRGHAPVMAVISDDYLAPTTSPRAVTPSTGGRR